MTFLFSNPLFTWLLPAATLPVIFHLFFKLKKRPRVFPTLMFFEQIDPKLSARRQIRQWLVLLLRVLFLFLLLLALARPIWLIGGGTGSVAVVCVIDNSGSMSPKLRKAVDAARALVANLAAKDSAGVVTLVEDPTVVLPAELNLDKSQTKSALDRIVETEATGEPASALRRAFALLEGSTATRFEVHVFTDLQEAKWSRPAGDFHAPRAGTTLYVHRIPTPAATAANVSILAADVPQRRLLTGRPIPLRVTLANPGAIDAAVKLTWIDDADNKGTLDVTSSRQSERNIPLLVTAAAPGFHWLQLALTGDGFEPDNRAGVGYTTAEKTPVVFLGDAADFGLLPLAISPAAEGVLSGLVPVFSKTDVPTNQNPALIVAPWELVERNAAPLKAYVEQGGNLLVLPAANGAAAPDWLGAVCGPVETQPKGTPVIIFSTSTVVFDDLRNEAGVVPLHNVKVFKFAPLRPALDRDVVLGLDDGRGLFLAHRLGKGNVFVSGLGFDASWSTLPLKGAFLAIAQNMALAHDAKADNVTALVAGQRIASTGSGPVNVHSLAGSALDWNGEAGHLPVLPRAGVYAVKAGSETRYVAVRSADKEGLAKFITNGQVPALAGLTYSVQTLEDIDSFLKQATKVRRGWDMFLPLLLLAILMLLLESWLANPPPRKLVGRLYESASRPAPLRRSGLQEATK